MQLSRNATCAILFAIFAATATATASEQLPPAKIRKEMLHQFVSEIERLDGDGLIPRTNRPEAWPQTILRLEQEAASAHNLFELGRAFRRLDATYSNLHAYINVLPDLDPIQKSGEVYLPFEFAPELVNRSQHGVRYFVSKLNLPVPGLRLGDEIVSINGTPIESWRLQNFIFCKFPLESQCNFEFYTNFRKELLGWSREQPLTFQFNQAGEIFSRQVPITFGPLQRRPAEDLTGAQCGVTAERYPGWRLSYLGSNLCAFESADFPDAVLIRIRSFLYDDGQITQVPINIDQEVQLFWTKYWKQHAPVTKTLILDVISNLGGDAPIPYYALFFPQPYQEMYVRFKKNQEFERKDILDSLFWGEHAKELWLDNIKRDGTFDAIKVGDFLPPVPQFCADQSKDCRQGLFPPRKNGFTGNIKLLINRECISSCVGFIFNIMDVLGDRVETYGMPDSGDSAYARLTLALNVPSNGHTYKTSVEGLDKMDGIAKPWIREAVTVSRSTDSRGGLLSGQPMRLDHWVTKSWDQTADQWAAQVVKAAASDSHPTNYSLGEFPETSHFDQ